MEQTNKRDHTPGYPVIFCPNCDYRGDGKDNLKNYGVAGGGFGEMVFYLILGGCVLYPFSYVILFFINLRKDLDSEIARYIIQETLFYLLVFSILGYGIWKCATFKLICPKCNEEDVEILEKGGLFYHSRFYRVFLEIIMPPVVLIVIAKFISFAFKIGGFFLIAGLCFFFLFLLNLGDKLQKYKQRNRSRIGVRH